MGDKIENMWRAKSESCGYLSQGAVMVRPTLWAAESWGYEQERQGIVECDF